jgi:glycopeptide antibiotics resistance protein
VDFGEILVIPWLLPGLVVSLVAAFVLDGPIERFYRTGPVLSWALVVSLGIIISATLTPSRDAIDSGAAGLRACDFSRLELAPIREILLFGDTGLNVLLFIPLGATIGLMPQSRHKAMLIAAAVALPFAIEAIQALVRSLDRACQSSDVVDNLTGLAIGLVAGLVVGRVGAAAGRSDR